MSEEDQFAQISLAAAEAIIRDGCEDFAFYLPGTGSDEPILYRESSAGLAAPNLERLHAHGVAHLFVRTSEINNCEAYLETRLADLLSHPEIAADDKARIVHQVGTAVARDLTKGPIESTGLERATHVIDNVIGTVLQDKFVAAHILQMADHERSTASHMFVVSALTVMLGSEFFGSDYEMLRTLGTAGMMHDLGKLGIDPDILNKTTPLTPDELDLIHQHPIESVRLLGNHPQITPAIRQMILQHHEWIDGRGYPLGLRGDEVLPGSRMISIADCFHAMIGRRPYRRPLTIDEASRALNAQAGRQFDPEILKVWNELLHRCTQQVGGPLPVAPSSVAGEQLATRNEHRAAPKRRTMFGPRAKRYSCNGNVNVKCYYAGRLADATCAPDEFNALLHDVSRNGLCLYSPYPMYRGEVVHIQIQQPTNPVWVRGLVAWCRQHEGTTFKVGLRFVQRISNAGARSAVEIKSLYDTRGDGNEKMAPDTQERSHTSTDGPSALPTTRTAAMEAIKNIMKKRRPELADERTAVALAKFPDAQVRLKAVALLMKIATKPARGRLMDLLNDEDRQVQVQAIAAAGALQMQEAQHTLRQLLLRDDQEIILRAAAALGRLGDQVGLSAVLQALDQDDDHTRLAAAALGDLLGQRFPANQHGVEGARRYLESKRADLLTKLEIKP